MLVRSAVLLALSLALAGPAVAPSVLNLYTASGTGSLSLDGVECGPAGSPVLVALGAPNAARERLSTLSFPGEGGYHLGSGSSSQDPLLSPSCLLVWTGPLVGTPSSGFVGTATDHVGPDPDCKVVLTLGAVGPSTPMSISGCDGALVGSGTLDFSPFVTS